MADAKLDRQEQKLIELYRAAEAKLLEELATDVGRGNLASAKYRTARLEAITGVLSQLQDKAVPAANELIGAAYISGSTAATRAVAGSLPAFGSGVHNEAMNIIADNLVSGLNQAAQVVGRTIEDAYRQAGLEAATELIGTGGTRASASRTLARLLEAKGINAGPGGASGWKLSRYTQMVIRTNTADAIIRGNVNTALQDGYDLVEVLVADPCDLCAPYDGEVFTLTDRAGYESIYDFGEGTLPPFHPNCRCDLNVLTEDPNAN